MIRALQPGAPRLAPGDALGRTLSPVYSASKGLALQRGGEAALAPTRSAHKSRFADSAAHRGGDAKAVAFPPRSGLSQAGKSGQDGGSKFVQSRQEGSTSKFVKSRQEGGSSKHVKSRQEGGSSKHVKSRQETGSRYATMVGLDCKALTEIIREPIEPLPYLETVENVTVVFTGEFRGSGPRLYAKQSVLEGSRWSPTLIYI